MAFLGFGASTTTFDVVLKEGDIGRDTVSATHCIVISTSTCLFLNIFHLAHQVVLIDLAQEVFRQSALHLAIVGFTLDALRREKTVQVLLASAVVFFLIFFQFRGRAICSEFCEQVFGLLGLGSR